MKNILYRYLIYCFIVLISLFHGNSTYSIEHGLLIQRPVSAVIMFLVSIWCFSDILENLKKENKK